MTPEQFTETEALLEEIRRVLERYRPSIAQMHYALLYLMLVHIDNLSATEGSGGPEDEMLEFVAHLRAAWKTGIMFGDGPLDDEPDPPHLPIRKGRVQ